jgi:glycogen debranching enzyme
MVSQFIDAAFNKNIFLWDTCFMTMFCKYGDPLVPAIGSLDNFYARQHEDGEICREIDRTTGMDHDEWINDPGGPMFSRWGWNISGADARRIPKPVVYIGRNAPEPPPFNTLDALNHPIFAWAELDSYLLTGDRERLTNVWEPLNRYYGALRKYLRQGNGLYITDWASMDNSPRNVYLIDGGTGVDISSEMALFARQMSAIGTMLGKRDEAANYARDADELATLINAKMWDPGRRFYFDLKGNGERAPVKTIGAYWPLLAKVASREQADALAAELGNQKTFGRMHRVPSCSADEPGYAADGAYWRGAVWVSSNTMVIRGLENYGKRDLARELALEHLDRVARVFEKTGTIWENYAPDSLEPGKPARRDFVGWSGLGPIMYLLEFAIGLKADAQANEMTWDLRSPARTGCERFRFNGHVITLVAGPVDKGRRRINVDSDGKFQLRIRDVRGRERSFAVKAGHSELVV